MGTLRKRKRFKIGEYALGGIIDVKLYDNRIEVIALEWNDPREAVMKEVFDFPWSMDKIEYWIDAQLTNSYYASKITDWIKARLADED
jgi:hypothetical protein